MAQSWYQELPPEFWDLVLPFILVFAIVYGLLSQVDVFNDDKPNVIISLIFAAFATYYNLIGPVMKALEGPWALWLILILMALITLQLVMDDPMGGRTGQIIAIIAVVGFLALLFGVNSSTGAGVSPLEGVFGWGDTGDIENTGLADIPILGDIIVDIVDSVGIAGIILILLAILAVLWMAGIGPF